MSQILVVRWWQRVSTPQAPVGVLAKAFTVSRVPSMGEVMEFEPPLIAEGESARATQVTIRQVVWLGHQQPAPVEARVYMMSEVNDAQVKDPDQRAEIERKIAVAASQGWVWPHPAYPQSQTVKAPDRAARRRAMPKKTEGGSK